MIKIDELRDRNSCLNRARDDEWLFTLLSRDAAAPSTIEFWIAERLRRGLNKPDDLQIRDAQRAVEAMRQQRVHTIVDKSNKQPS